MSTIPEFKYEKELSHQLKAKKRKLQQYRQIVAYLYHNKSASTAEIAKFTKLSQPSVASLINELIEFGVVKDNGIGASIGGRKPNLYGLEANYQYVIGVDVSINSIKLGLFNLDNEVVAQAEHKDHLMENSPEYLKFMMDQIKDLLDKANIATKDVLALGLSLPGLVDAEKGESYSHLTFTEESLAKCLMKRLDFPVLLDNDARIMALGEKAFGKAQNKKNVLCLNLSYGIGLGIILNGQLYSGKNGFAGEFGHILINPEGELCYCGKIGCLETVASGNMLVNKIEKAIANGQASLLANQTDKKLNIRTIVEAVKHGDQFAIDQLTQLGEHLGKGLVTLIHLLNPEMILIGGKLAHAGKYITDPVNMTLNRHAMDRIRIETEIVSSDLLDDAALMGTMANVMEVVLSASVY
ncbi:MAG: ROK family protein [Marinifilaceae bacterium]